VTRSGLCVYVNELFRKHHSRARDGIQAARARRSTALTAPELTGSSPCGPGPAGPDTLVGEHARAPQTPSFRRAQGSDWLVVDEGVLSPDPPRAQEGDKRKPLAADHPLGIAGVVGQGRSQALLELRPYAWSARLPERARPITRRSARMLCGLPLHQGLKSEVPPLVRTTTRGSGYARLCQHEATPQITASSTGATRQAEIDQRFQELEMRRVPDSKRLSGILEPRQRPSSPVRCPAGSRTCRGKPAHAGNVAAWNDGYMLQLLTGACTPSRRRDEFQHCPCDRGWAHRHPAGAARPADPEAPVVIGGIG
jgi:hypothetical protein